MASSITQAREGTLYLMIGGKKEVFEYVKDLLDDLSINLRFVGEAGRAALLGQGIGKYGHEYQHCCTCRGVGYRRCSWT